MTRDEILRVTQKDSHNQVRLAAMLVLATTIGAYALNNPGDISAAGPINNCPYALVKGDNPSVIDAKLGLPRGTTMNLNSIPDPTKMHVGNIVMVPCNALHQPRGGNTYSENATDTFTKMVGLANSIPIIRNSASENVITSIKNDIFVALSGLSQAGVPKSRLEQIARRQKVVVGSSGSGNWFFFDHMEIDADSPRAILHEIPHGVCGVIGNKNNNGWHSGLTEGCAQWFTNQFIPSDVYGNEVVSLNKLEQFLIAGGKLKPNKPLPLVISEISAQCEAKNCLRDVKQQKVVPLTVFVQDLATKYGIKSALVQQEIDKLFPD